MERRTFLSAGSVSVLAFAAGPRFTADDALSNDPADVVRAYYRRASVADTEAEFADSVPELAHSASPLLDVAADIPEVFEGTIRQDLVEVGVVEEDVDSDEISGMSDFFAGSVSAETIETLAEENAIVAVTLESDDIVGGAFAKEWLVAPEDGEWRLVWFDGRNSPRAAAREFFRRVNLPETLGGLDDPVAEWTHSVSPLVNVAEYTPWYFRGLRRQTLDRTAVATENIDTDQIVSQFTPVTNWASRDEIEAIAEENAVVAVSLSDEQFEAEQVEQNWLVAPDGGEWRLVWF